MPRAAKSRVIAWIALLAMLVGTLGITATDDFPHQFAMDLYHPWGVQLAQQHSLTRQNPYANTPEYGAFINAKARESASAALRWNADFWAKRTALKIEPTGTPLFYAAHAWLPDDFDRAHRVYAVLQFIAATAGIFLLARLRGYGIIAALCLAALVEITFNPFAQDLKVGNANTLQFLVMAGLLYVAVRRLYERHPAIDLLYLGAMAFFLVLKPNSLLIIAALAIHYAWVRGMRRFVAGSAIAAVFAAVGFAWGGWYFGGVDVWWDWYRYTQGMNGGTLVYTTDQGNQALAVMLQERGMPLPPAVYSAIIAAVLVFAYYAAASAMGRRPDLVVPVTRRVLADPWLMASAAAVAMFAVSPLLWPHYFMFALIPMVGLARFDRRPDFATICVVLSFIAFSRHALGVLHAQRMIGAVYSILFFAWLPLVPALLARVAGAREQLAPRGAPVPARA